MNKCQSRHPPYHNDELVMEKNIVQRRHIAFPRSEPLPNVILRQIHCQQRATHSHVTDFFHLLTKE